MEAANKALVHLLDQATTFSIGSTAIDMGDDSLALSIHTKSSEAAFSIKQMTRIHRFLCP
jgi:hypothetical protein